MEPQSPQTATPQAQQIQTPNPGNPPEQKGMSKILIGVLIGLGLLPFAAIGVAIILIAINPAKNFAQANNTKRRNDTLQILNAVWAYAGANQGNLPTEITTSPQEISSTGADICAVLVPSQMVVLPVDPSLNGGSISDCSVQYKTGYIIQKDPNTTRITITAPRSELGETITVSR